MSVSDDLLGPRGDQPRRFGDYLVHGLLGEGGMARIYAAEEVLSGRAVALKIPRSEFAHSEQGRRQFIREMNILSSLDDPHIVRCLSCVEIEQQPVMVLEQLDGWTLRELLKHRVALPWAEAASIAVQIARALDAAHSRRPPIIHRDLKPENIMYLRSGQVKVMDFGIAKILQSLAGATTHPIGTLQYMSPEHVDARPVDPRSDLFALGVVLWEMLAGRPPFASESPRELLEQICARPTPPLPDYVRAGLPMQLEPLLHRLLAKSPDDRPSSAREVIVALEPLVGGPGLHARVHAQRARSQSPTSPSPSAVSVGPALDTAAIVESAAKHPLQKRMEEQFDEVAQAVSRFGRATSVMIVRVLIGLMIFPAAAVVAILVPAVLATLNVSLLEDEGLLMFRSDFDTWAAPEIIPVLAVAAVVFVRACWVHHRAPQDSMLLRLWFGLGALILLAWGAVTGIEFGTGSTLDREIHYAAIAGATSWLTITLSWIMGRVTSLVLRQLERARAAH